MSSNLNIPTTSWHADESADHLGPENHPNFLRCTVQSSRVICKTSHMAWLCHDIRSHPQKKSDRITGPTNIQHQLLTVLLKHGRDGNDGRDGRHGCTVVNSCGLNLCVVPSLTEPGDRNLGRQIKFREGGYVQRFKLIINWGLAVKLSPFYR